MVASSAHKSYVGNVCLYRDLAKPEFRTFLSRNLNTVLDEHEKQLARASDAVNYHTAMASNRYRPAEWEYPTNLTKETLGHLSKGHKPVLRVDAFQIRRKGTRRKEPQSTAKQAHDDAELGWLPDKDADMRVPCQVKLQIHNTDHTSHGSKKEDSSVHTDTRPASIESQRIDDDSRIFNIAIHEPFMVELDNIRTRNMKYSLGISIACRDSDDAMELLHLLDPRVGATIESMSASFPTLKAFWGDFPECPPADELLPLDYQDSSMDVALEYGLDVSMGWNRRDLPLARYNRVLGSSQELDGMRQLPTPGASEDLETATKQIRITYVFQEGLQSRSADVEGLVCPLCGLGVAHSSFDRLHLHLLIRHDLFKAEVDIAEELESGASHRTVRLTLAEKPEERAGSATVEEREFEWIAPQRPFNMSAYLHGNDRWTGHTRPKAPRGRGRPPKEGREAASLMAPAIPQPAIARPAPAEVANLPLHSRKKHRVPTVPGVTFYRTPSKKPILSDEYVSESDEDIDDRWVNDVHRRDFRELGLPSVQQEFLEDWNKHLDDEQPSSDILAREAIVRFSRQFSAKLQDEGWRAHFKRQLTLLQRHGILDLQAVSYCLGEVQSELGAEGDGREKTSCAPCENDPSQAQPGAAKGSSKRSRLQRDSHESIEAPPNQQQTTDDHSIARSDVEETTASLKSKRFGTVNDDMADPRTARQGRQESLPGVGTRARPTSSSTTPTPGPAMQRKWVQELGKFVKVPLDDSTAEESRSTPVLTNGHAISPNEQSRPRRPAVH